jgi:2-phospho-L-lactate guanylyltransferase (CobY/MobA/RfbA family)
MRIPPTLMRKAVRAVRLAMLTSTAVAGTASAESAQVVSQDHGIEQRLLAVRLALAQQALSAPSANAAEDAEEPTRIAQWKNGSDWRNSGWRNS